MSEENYYKKYPDLMEKYGITEEMYYWDMISIALRRLGLLE